MINNPKIFNYARVSTTKQLKGVGLETQQQRGVLTHLSNEYELPIHDENFVDQGLSAYHGKHKEGEFGRVLELIETGRISHGSILVVFSLDRLSRESVNIAMGQLLSIINNGVRVYTHIDNKMFDAQSPNLAADLIISLIVMQRANEESETKSRRTKASQKQALKLWKETREHQRGLGRVPLWVDQPTNTLNQNAEGIKAAVELFLKGLSTIKVKQHLDINYPYKRIRTKNTIKSASTWDYGSLDQLWKKRSLVGEKRIKIDGIEHVLPEYYPPLISLETFNRLQKLKQPKLGRATSSGSIHLLKGLARCGICGSAMVFVDKGNHSKNYVCSLAIKGEPLHNREVYSAELLELLTAEICKDKYLINSFNSQLDLKEKADVEFQLSDAKSNLEELNSRYKQKARLSLLDLIEDTEDKIESLQGKLASFDKFDVAKNVNLLQGEVLDEEVRCNFSHSKRVEIIENLQAILDKVVLSRTEKKSDFSKTGSANCVSITWKFKNGQSRTISVEPFKYIGKGTTKKLFVSFKYEYSVPSKDRLGDEENRRGESFVPKLLELLHQKKLLPKLYPSKGRYTWDKLQLEVGEFKTGLSNFAPSGLFSQLIANPDTAYVDVYKNEIEKGIYYTVSSYNILPSETIYS